MLIAMFIAIYIAGLGLYAVAAHAANRHIDKLAAKHMEEAEHAGNCACARCFSEGVGAWASANPPEHGPVLVTYVSERGSRLPVVNLTCFCGVDIPAEQVQDDAQVWISRVNGDSRYGYEAYHAACCKSRRSLV